MYLAVIKKKRATFKKIENGQSSVQNFLSETKVHIRQDGISKVSLSFLVGFEFALCPCSLRRKDL